MHARCGREMGKEERRGEGEGVGGKWREEKEEEFPKWILRSVFSLIL